MTTVNYNDIQNLTLRQPIRSTIGGTAARIKISNLYGTQAVTFADVHLARSTGFNQPTTVAGTDVQLTFGGASSITLQPGCDALSDVKAVTIQPLTDYLVSIFTNASNPGGLTSGLDDSFDGTDAVNSFIYVGDVSSQTNPANSLLGSLSRRFFLTNLDVHNSSATGMVVAIGASITQGRLTNGQAHNRWTDLLAQRMNQAGISMGVGNMGISGNNLITNQLANNSGDSMLDRFSHDVLQQANAKFVIISDDALNDLASNSVTPQLAPTLISAYQTLISQAHAKNIKVICSTLTPDGGFQAQAGETDTEPLREQINTFLTGMSSGCDAIFDQAKTVQDPTDIINILPAFNTFQANPSDGLHPNTLGHQQIANAFNLRLFEKTGILR